MTRRGFSLLEVVVVLIIVAVLAALAIPRLAGDENEALWFRDEAAAAVRYAQRQAVAQRRCVFVSSDGANLRLFYGDASCAITATPLTQIANGNPYEVNAPAGVAMDVMNFSFDGLGRPTPAGLTLNVGPYRIVVAAETGYVQAPP